VQRAVRYVLLVSLPIAVGTSLLADRLIAVLYTETFAPAAPVLRLLAWTLPSLFLSEILGYTAVSLHLERALARINVRGTLIGAVLLVTGVATFGLTGAAAAAVITRFFVTASTVALLGPARVVGDSVGGLLRIGASAAVMGVGVAALLSLPQALPSSAAAALAILIATGFVLYLAAVLVSRAVDVTERRFLMNAATQAFRRIAARA